MVIYFDYAAVLLLAVLLITAFMRNLTKGMANRTMLAAVAVTCLTTVFDIVSVYHDGLPNQTTVQYLANTGYLYCHVLSSTFYLFYLISVADTWHKLRAKPIYTILLLVPFAAFTFLLFTSEFTGLIFYIDADGHYVRGSMFFINYLISGIYLFLGLSHLFIYRRQFDRQSFFVMLAPYPMLIFSMVIQFFYPHLLVEMFADSLALLMVWMNIQRPEELLDPQTGFGNRATYHLACRRAFALEKPMYIIRIEIKQIAEIKEAFGIDAILPLINTIAEKLNRCNKQAKAHANICHTADKTFFILIDERYFHRVDDLGELLSKELYFTYEYGKASSEIRSYLCLYRIPQDINSFEMIGNLGNLFVNKTDLPNNTLLTAELIFREKSYRLKMDINSIIDRALKNMTFKMYYQPIYDIKARRFTGAEALLRLWDEQYGFIPPDFIVTAAEENGIMYLIDEFVLNETVRMLSERRPERFGLHYLDINLSTHQCKQDDLSKVILDTIGSYGVPAGMINLEITETAAADAFGSAIDNFRALREAGIHISLDDFGKGFSNLRQIATFPLDMVKLDKSLTDIGSNGAGAVLVSSIISMLNEMHVAALVEGVETAEQARLFEQYGCDHIQGYYYAKPMSEDEFITFLQEQNSED